MTDEELERTVRAATAGPWRVGDATDTEKVRGANGEVARTACLGDWDNATAQQEADARYIAALNPEAALALLTRARAAEAKVERLRLSGSGLANVAYNLKQLGSIPEEHRRTLDEAQRGWDAAVREQGKSPLTIPARRPTPPPTAPVLLLAQQIVLALNDCTHGGGGPTGCAACEPMLASLREAGVAVEPVGEGPAREWRLKP